MTDHGRCWERGSLGPARSGAAGLGFAKIGGSGSGDLGPKIPDLLPSILADGCVWDPFTPTGGTVRGVRVTGRGGGSGAVSGGSGGRDRRGPG